MIRHAGFIALWTAKGWRGVLIDGPSGAGKSDLALRARAEGFRCVADDRVRLWRSGAQVFGGPHENLAGLMEIRGVGVVAECGPRLAPVSLVARCGAPERLPDPQSESVLGLMIPVLVVEPLHASAPAKLRRALDIFDEGARRRI